jgi:hypothetical protein
VCSHVDQQGMQCDCTTCFQQQEGHGHAIKLAPVIHARRFTQLWAVHPTTPAPSTAL